MSVCLHSIHLQLELGRECIVVLAVDYCYCLLSSAFFVNVGDSGWAQFKDGCVVVVAIDSFQPVVWYPRELHRKFLLGEGARLGSVALRG